MTRERLPYEPRTVQRHLVFMLSFLFIKAKRERAHSLHRTIELHDGRIRTYPVFHIKILSFCLPSTTRKKPKDSTQREQQNYETVKNSEN